MSQTVAVPERRRRLRAAVLRTPVPQDEAPPPCALGGRVLDATPGLLVLCGDDGAELRLALTDATMVWHGGRAGTDALRPGREVIVRPGPDGAADRVWVEITRVCGTITGCAQGSVEVDTGPHREPVRVGIPAESFRQIQVRHPRLEPGYLFDAIAVRSADGPLAVRPGTSQPAHRAEVAPPRRPVAPGPLRGTVSWYGGPGRGAAYPALDPEGDAGGHPGAPVSCAALPYLSLGSSVRVRNECAERAGSVPVVQCGCAAARYCDRCVRCGTSPRGRLLELTALSFVDFGGELDAGCFNATVSVD